VATTVDAVDVLHVVHKGAIAGVGDGSATQNLTVEALAGEEREGIKSTALEEVTDLLVDEIDVDAGLEGVVSSRGRKGVGNLPAMLVGVTSRSRANWKRRALTEREVRTLSQLATKMRSWKSARPLVLTELLLAVAEVV
jgi:hypothetical protein